jgi:hypothetical protein
MHQSSQKGKWNDAPMAALTTRPVPRLIFLHNYVQFLTKQSIIII